MDKEEVIRIRKEMNSKATKDEVFLFGVNNVLLNIDLFVVQDIILKDEKIQKFLNKSKINILKNRINTLEAFVLFRNEKNLFNWLSTDIDDKDDKNYNYVKQIISNKLINKDLTNFGLSIQELFSTNSVTKAYLYLEYYEKDYYDTFYVLYYDLIKDGKIEIVTLEPGLTIYSKVDFFIDKFKDVTTYFFDDIELTEKLAKHEANKDRLLSFLVPLTGYNTQRTEYGTYSLKGELEDIVTQTGNLVCLTELKKFKRSDFQSNMG